MANDRISPHVPRHAAFKSFEPRCYSLSGWGGLLRVQSEPHTMEEFTRGLEISLEGLVAEVVLHGRQANRLLVPDLSWNGRVERPQQANDLLAKVRSFGSE